MWQKINNKKIKLRWLLEHWHSGYRCSPLVLGGLCPRSSCSALRSRTWSVQGWVHAAAQISWKKKEEIFGRISAVLVFVEATIVAPVFHRWGWTSLLAWSEAPPVAGVRQSMLYYLILFYFSLLHQRSPQEFALQLPHITTEQGHGCDVCSRDVVCFLA